MHYEQRGRFLISLVSLIVPTLTVGNVWSDTQLETNLDFVDEK